MTEISKKVDFNMSAAVLLKRKGFNFFLTSISSEYLLDHVETPKTNVIDDVEEYTTNLILSVNSDFASFMNDVYEGTSVTLDYTDQKFLKIIDGDGVINRLKSRENQENIDVPVTIVFDADIYLQTSFYIEKNLKQSSYIDIKKRFGVILDLKDVSNFEKTDEMLMTDVVNILNNSKDSLLYGMVKQNGEIDSSENYFAGSISGLTIFDTLMKYRIVSNDIKPNIFSEIEKPEVLAKVLMNFLLVKHVPNSQYEYAKFEEYAKELYEYSSKNNEMKNYTFDNLQKIFSSENTKE